MSRPSALTSFFYSLLGVVLLWGFFAQVVIGMPRLSLTADEPVYMSNGYAFLRTGDRRMAVAAQHPLLMQILAAAPLLLQPGPRLTELAGWETGEMVRFAPAFVAWYGGQLDAATFAARFPTVLLALLWGACLFRWAKDEAGPWGGIVALTLFAFDPNLLAHAGLATNDVGFAAFSFMAIFFAVRYVRLSPSHWGAGPSQAAPSVNRNPLFVPSLFQIQRSQIVYGILAGLALGGSLSAKSSGFFTALVLLVLFPLDALLSASHSRRQRLVHNVLALIVILLIGGGVLWATYGFQWRPSPLATHRAIWRAMRMHLDEGHTGYLMGQIRETGWRLYYPIVFGLKTPLWTLLLGIFSVGYAVASGPRYWVRKLSVGIYLGGYLAAVLLSTVSTGYRFLLPMLPFGFLLVADFSWAISRWFCASNRRSFRSLYWLGWLGLLTGGLALSLWLHPHYLTYFNRIAGGPRQGHHYVVDSNLDWGQSFKTLQAYLQRNHIEEVHLSYYTYAGPQLYGFRIADGFVGDVDNADAILYHPLAPAPKAPPVFPGRFNPEPGVYVISATTLQGMMVADPDMYSWFRQRQPMAQPGNALFVYDVQVPASPPAWLAQCTYPAAPLPLNVIGEGFRRTDLRISYFDCTQSWLFPTGGVAPGWYALHATSLSDSTPSEGDAASFIQAQVSAAHCSYGQRTNREIPAFTLYEQPQGQPYPLSHPDFHPAPVNTLDGPLTFLGHVAPLSPIHPGEIVEIITLWQVVMVPQRPLSLMLHLKGPGDRPVLVGDGLGVPLEHWRIGDVIAQRHVMQIPPDAVPGAHTPLVGAYWLNVGDPDHPVERWLFSLPSGERDHISLPPLQVRP